MKRRSQSLLLGAAVLLTVASAVAPALACGGFFCNASQPVNQAAERIIFARNDDGTVTAVIQIQYAGPAEKFAWLLPIPTAPTPDQFRVASEQAFTRLQNLTNPQYTLTTRVEGSCKPPEFLAGPPAATATFAPTTTPDSVVVDEAPSPVVVQASGSVGPFDWEVISVQEGTEDPAVVAVQWLGEHDYAVPESTSGLVAPYLEEGLFLLAVKLTKTASTGSIRPIVITYAAEQAMIPVKLTSVAANDDMGVMTWLLGEGRGVPQNYLSLELNEARINWFSAGTNYNQVVIEAADDSGGQGFVTEYAGDASAFADQVWMPSEATQWQTFQETVFDGLDQMFDTAYAYYAGYDGFWDAIERSVTLSQSVSMDDFKACPSCYADQISFSPGELMQALDELVIQPMTIVQELIDDHPQMTRLYTTLSADEMTVDPLFAFNPDLEDVSNVHTAERIIECNANIYESQANWRIELPQGETVRGTASEASSLVWPEGLGSLPPNRTIRRQSTSGSGKVLEDNAGKIKDALATYNDGVAEPTPPAPMPSDTAAVPSDTAVPSSAGSAAPPAASDGHSDTPTSDTSGSSGAELSLPDDTVDEDGGCALKQRSPGGQGPFGMALAWLVAVGIGRELQKRRRASDSRGR